MINAPIAAAMPPSSNATGKVRYAMEKSTIAFPRTGLSTNSPTVNRDEI